MRVLRLILRDFISYSDLDLDLSDVKMAVVTGKNGAGKSSLLDAVTFALYGKGRAQTLSKFIRDGTDTATVRLDFEAGGAQYTVERTVTRSGQGNVLSFLSSNEDVLDNRRKHTAPETQEAIISTIGLTYDALRAGPLMIQGQSGNFMAMDPSARKVLLTKLLGLERYERYAKYAHTQAVAYQREAAATDAQIVNLAAIVDGEEQATFDLREARRNLATAEGERERLSEEITGLKEKRAGLAEQARHADSLRQTVQMLEARIASDQNEQKRQLREVSAAHQLSDAPAPTFAVLPDVSDAEIGRRKAAWDEAHEIDRKASILDVQIQSAEQGLTHLRTQHSIVATVPCHGDGIFASCRFLSTAPTEVVVSEAEAALGAMRYKRTALINGGEPASILRASYESLVAEQSSVQQQRLRQEAAQEQWHLKMDQAKATIKSSQDAMRRIEAQMTRDLDVHARSAKQLSEVDVDRATIEALEASIASVTMTIEEAARSIDIVYRPALRHAEETMTRIRVAKEQMAPLVKTLAEVTGKHKVYAVLAKAFHRDGIPTLILEGSIPVIEQRANEVLERMPDSYIVRVLTQREGTAKTMERLSIVVERNGRERDYENLSGGEQFRIDFAIRIALAQLAAGRSGTTWQTAIIDEGFGSQDEDGIEAMLESISAIEDDFGLILIISHQKSVIDRAETRVEVARDEDSSYAIVRG